MPPPIKLTDYNPNRRKGGPDRKYPWDQWLTGETIRLLQGRKGRGHFQCSTKSMETLARYHIGKLNARRKEQKLPPMDFHVYTERNPPAIVIQCNDSPPSKS